VSHFGGLDIVVANAGINTFGALATIEPAQFERVLEVNLLGCWRTLRAVVPHVAQRRGFVLTVSSMAAALQSPLQAHYAASKAAVAAMTHALRIELHGTGASAGVAHPYFVETDMIRETRDSPGGAAIWRGNRGGLYETVPLHVAVDGLVRANENRRHRTAIPGYLLPAVLAPGLVQPWVERLARLRHADYVDHL
jgi:NAD(P)-dependent dehydrogenase (short-subunit alcohol dehydrogenase family)